MSHTPTREADSAAITLPAPRRWVYIGFVLFGVLFSAFVLAGFVVDIVSSATDFLVRAAVMVGVAVVAAVFLPQSLWSLLGWESVSVDGQTLRLERHLFGRTVRRLEIVPTAVRSDAGVNPDTEKLEDLARKQGELAFWTFTRGPIEVEHAGGTIRFGEGLEGDPERARVLVEALRVEFLG